MLSGQLENTNEPYALAKIAGTKMCQSYNRQYKTNFIACMPTNLYGPRDNFDLDSSHVIPALIRKCIEARESKSDCITAWGDGSPTREFLYVSDAAEGILLASEHYNSSAPVNLGSSIEISIKELTEQIAKLTGFNGKINWDLSKPNGQPRRKLDVSRAIDFFGFEATTNFEIGLKKTIEWYEQCRTETQIISNNNLEAGDLKEIQQNSGKKTDGQSSCTNFLKNL